MFGSPTLFAGPRRPVCRGPDTADTVTLDETVSTALLVVLESLIPACVCGGLPRRQPRRAGLGTGSGRGVEVRRRRDSECRPPARVRSIQRGQLPAGDRGQEPGPGRGGAGDRDGIALAFRRDGRTVGVMSLNVAGETVKDVWIVLNPDKLGLWN
jgi:hypothetical protein